MKNQNGRELGRDWAPNKRNPNDKYKVTIVRRKPDYNVTQDEVTNRPIVTKNDE